MAEAHIDALRSSVARLRDITSAMSEAGLTGRAYPARWSIAQVLSHLGSGGVIMHGRLDDTLAGRATPDDYPPGVWDTWNATTPLAQRDDGLAADAALMADIEATTPAERSGFSMSRVRKVTPRAARADQPGGAGARPRDRRRQPGATLLLPKLGVTRRSRLRREGDTAVGRKRPSRREVGWSSCEVL